MDNPMFHPVCQLGDFVIGVRKPGKEAAPTFPSPNPHDMLPSIQRGGAYIEYTPGFTTIFEELQGLAVGRNNLALEHIGCLLFRAAYMLDHEEIGPGIWRFAPPRDVIDEVERWAPQVAGIPTSVFLHLIEVLAWNEDEKYAYREYDIGTGIGRTNNLGTCAHIIAVFLGRASIVRFAGGLARPPSGVNPITQKAAREAFPLLDGRPSSVV